MAALYAAGLEAAAINRENLRAKLLRYERAYGLQRRDLRKFKPCGGRGKLKRRNKQRRMQAERMRFTLVVLSSFDPPRRF